MFISRIRSMGGGSSGPVTPLAVVSTVAGDFLGLPSIVITFDQPAVAEGTIAATLDGGNDIVGPVTAQSAPTAIWQIVCDPGIPTTITFGTDAAGFRSASGGYVTPGVYNVS